MLDDRGIFTDIFFLSRIPSVDFRGVWRGDEIDVEIDSSWCAMGGQRQRGNYREKLFIPSPNITLRMRLEQKYLFVCKKNQWKCLVDEKCKMKNAISSKRSSDSIDWPKHSECVLHENINEQTQ